MKRKTMNSWYDFTMELIHTMNPWPTVTNLKNPDEVTIMIRKPGQPAARTAAKNDSPAAKSWLGSAALMIIADDL
jgi:hypothetical protein